MGSIGSFILIYIGGLLLLLFLMVILPGKRKNRQVRQMHDSVKVGDEIATIGGIIGTVVSRDADIVTILIDEKTGTTMRLVIQAVQSILTPADGTPMK